MLIVTMVEEQLEQMLDGVTTTNVSVVNSNAE